MALQLGSIQLEFVKISDLPSHVYLENKSLSIVVSKIWYFFFLLLLFIREHDLVIQRQYPGGWHNLKDQTKTWANCNTFNTCAHKKL